MYTFDSRIRYSEINEKGALSLPGLINYFQDCSTFQSEDIGLGVEALKKRNKVWVLSYWQIEINRYPELGEQVKTGTFATAFKGLYGHRNFVLYDQKSQMLACADSIWAYIDLTKGRPTKPEPEEIAPYGMAAPLAMEQMGRKIARLEAGHTYPAFTVQKYHLDTNMHVNNGQYVQMAMNLLSDELVVKRLRVEYKKSAVLGDMIYPKVGEEENRTVVELCDENGNLYAIIEIRGENG